MSSGRESYLVIGGSGLLGRHIVETLLERGRYDDVPFYSGDISEDGVVLEVLQKCGATCVFNTASPPGDAAIGHSPLYEKVNVVGTNNILKACVEAGVRKFIYTSSSGVVFNGSDIDGVDENYPFPKTAMNDYLASKVKAETAVLAANGERGLLTVALRPSGVFGPGDRMAIVGMDRIYRTGGWKVQVGNNKNLTDWTYVTNVSDAHILAADKLTDSPASPDMAVAGEVFFITNDDPWPFWNMTNAVWDRLDAVYPGMRPVKTKPWIIPRKIGLIMGALSEFSGWLAGRKPTFTRQSITFSCCARWHDISKAKRVLGYKPQVSMNEGLDKLIEWWRVQPEVQTEIEKLQKK